MQVSCFSQSGTSDFNESRPCSVILGLRLVGEFVLLMKVLLLGNFQCYNVGSPELEG